MLSRARQVQLAFILPIGFLMARAIYALIFGGARFGNTLIVELPEIRLAGPFAHVTMLGSIYLEGLLASLSTALPFSVFMLAIGLVMVFIRPVHMFLMADRVPAFRPLILAIAIGWIQIPSLIMATSRISRAIKLRKERKHRAVLPILESAIESALSIAQRLTLSGERSRSTSGNLEVSNLFIEEAGLREVSFTVHAGECLVISGPTGAGKSSLLLAATGLAAELGLSVSGQITSPVVIGYVSQRTRDQLFGPLVKDEIAFTQHFGLDSKFDRPVHQLSEGEAITVSVVRELQKQPQLLILDEPLSSLDESTTQELIELLRDYLSSGGALLIAEHKPQVLVGITTNFMQILDGKLVSGRLPESNAAANRVQALFTSDEVYKYQADSIGYLGKLLISAPVIPVRQSEVIAITGPNGAGKSTLLNAIHSSFADSVLVPELVSDFFVTTSLQSELDRADRIAKVEKGFTADNLLSILGELPDLKTHPRDLSAGTQVALAIAMQLSHRPRILLIDEPARGFDEKTKAQVVATLECVRETGCAVIFASHDPQLVSRLATSVYEISNFELKQIGKVMA